MNLDKNDFKIILGALPYGVTVQDLNGKIIYANNLAVRIVGYKTVKEFLNAPLEDLPKRFSVKDELGNPISFDNLPGRRALLSKKSENSILRFHTYNNQKEYWSWVTAVPIKDKNSKLTGILNTFYDLTENKNAQEAQKLLNEISDELSSSLSYDIRLKRLVEIIVPKIADWCAVDILDNEDNIQRVAVAHIDPKKVALAKELQKKFPQQKNDKTGVMNVIHTGKVEIYPIVDQKLISKRVTNNEQKKILLELEINSVALVPLHIRGKVLGVITFAYAESKRTYDRNDISMLETFAHRAAMLLDNSRLFETAQRVIQEQRETYKSLQASDNTLRLALDVGKMGIWDWEIGEDKFTWSDGFKPLYGLRHGNIGGTLEKFLLHIHSVDRNRVRSNLKNAVKNLGEYEDEFRIVWPDNTIHWMFKKGQVLNDGEGKAVRLIGIGMDVTERKVSELALKTSENKFKSIFGTSLDSILVVDDKMEISEINEASSNLLLLSQNKLNKRKLIDILSLDTKNLFIKQWKQFQKKGIQRGELEVTRNDGKTLIVEYSAKAQFLPNRNLIILRDITERKEEEKRREHLLGIASHELRTPLASIKAFVEILKRSFINNKDNKISYYLSKIDDKTETLSQLITDLLDMTRIREGKLEFYYEVFDLDNLLDEIIADIGFTNKSHSILKIGSIKKDIIADRNRIAQVIINVIKNAIKYSPKSNKIRIRVHGEENAVTISIQDFGIGIPLSDHKKIFDIFYRGENTAIKRVGGLGVGLFISAEIVKKHGGKMWVESQLGKGSTFFINLPLVPKLKIKKKLNSI